MVTVCLGPQQTEIKETNTRHQCILCQVCTFYCFTNVLYCTLLYFTVLYFTLPYSTVLYSSVLLYYTQLNFTLPYCTVLFIHINCTESEFNKFEPHLKFIKNRFQLSASLYLETLNTI